MCCVSGRTGRLQVAQKSQRACVYLQNGQIIHAVCGSDEGIDAVYNVLCWPLGRFEFETGVQSTQHTIKSVGWEHLLMESVRRRDELIHDLPRKEAAADTPGADLYLGSYYLCGTLQEDEHTRIYDAVHIFTEQKVLLHTLRPEFQCDADVVGKFVSDANIKAYIQHPAILPVHPIEEAAGVHFYARQFLDSVSLAVLRMQGGVIDDAVALQLTISVADAFCHLADHQIATSPLTADDLLLSGDGQARINNIATSANRTGTLVTPAQRDIRALAHFIVEMLPNRTPQSVSLRALFAQMLQAGLDGYLDWPALRQAVEGVELLFQPDPPHLLEPRTDLAVPILLTELTACTNSNAQVSWARWRDWCRGRGWWR